MAHRARHEHGRVRRDYAGRGPFADEDYGRDSYASNFFGAPLYGYGYADDREGYGPAPRGYRGGFGYGGYGQSNVNPRFGTDYRPDDRHGPDLRSQAATGGGYGGHGGYAGRAGENQGYRGEGRHRGKGPRNYARSDARIEEDVNERLTDDPHLDASGIEVRVAGSEVTLDGTVDTRASKRLAEDIAGSVPGVRHVQNNLRIPDPAHTE